MSSTHTPSAGNLESERRYALLIAVGQFADPDLRDLNATVADAMSLSDLLKDPIIGGYEVTTAFNQSLSAVNITIDDFFLERRPDDLALVYVSTHGLLDTRGRLFFAMADTRHDRLALTALEAEVIRKQMDDSRARQIILLLDTSFSGAFMRGVM